MKAAFQWRNLWEHVCHREFQYSAYTLKPHYCFSSKLEMFEALEISQGQQGRAPLKVLFLCHVKGKETRLKAFISK